MLDCPHVSNPPTSSVQWLKGNQDLLLEEDKYTTFENGSLLILNLMNDDNGNYTCRVQNIRGMDQATYRVQVISKLGSSLLNYKAKGTSMLSVGV